MASAGESTTNSSKSQSQSSSSSNEPAAPTVTPPLASPGTFELYDPRGLLTRRRSQSRSSNATASPAEKSTGGTAGAAGVGNGRDRKDSTATQSSLTSVKEDDDTFGVKGPTSLVSGCWKKSYSIARRRVHLHEAGHCKGTSLLSSDTG